MKKVAIELRQGLLSLGCNTNLSPTPHFHKDIEIIYIKKGHAFCYADNKIYEVKDGDIFLCFPNQLHYYLNAEMGEYYIYIFSPDLLHGIKNIFMENNPENNVFNTEKNSSYAELFLKIYNEQSSYKETIQVGLLNQLMPLFLSHSVLVPKIQSGSQTLQAILNFCTQNFTSDISLDDISEALHFSKYHISHLFNQKLNISFNQYINTLRIYEACNLMEEGNKSLAYISEEVGFGSIRSFNRAFLQIMNITPLKYYKQINSVNRN